MQVFVVRIYPLFMDGILLQLPVDTGHEFVGRGVESKDASSGWSTGSCHAVVDAGL